MKLMLTQSKKWFNKLYVESVLASLFDLGTSQSSREGECDYRINKRCRERLRLSN